MGEIKSTLDLVLEKTKHLTWSPEEKALQEREEAQKRIKGLIQNYQEHRIEKKDVAQALDAIKAVYPPAVKDVLVPLVLAGVDLGLDNAASFELLSEFGGLDTGSLAAVCDDFKGTIRSMAQERLAAMKTLLADKHGISGSAVVPNVEADRQWMAELVKLKAEFAVMLQNAKAGLLPA